MAFAHIQGAEAANPSITAKLDITTSATTQNNLVVVNFYYLGIDTPTVIDNASTPNSYSAANHIRNTAGGFSEWQFYGVQVTGGATKITISPANGTDINDIYGVVDEYSGNTTSSVLDTSKTSFGNNGSNSSVATFSPAATGELIVAGIATQQSVSSQTAGTSYIIGTIGSSDGDIFSEQLLSGTTSETAPASWTTNSNWAEVAGAYKAATIVTPTSVNFTKAPTVMILR